MVAGAVLALVLKVAPGKNPTSGALTPDSVAGRVPTDLASSYGGLPVRRVVTVLAAVVVALPLASVTSFAAPVQGPVFADGQAQPVFDPNDIVRDNLWVNAAGGQRPGRQARPGACGSRAAARDRAGF